MANEVRDFITMDKAPTESMNLEDLKAELEGWRVIFRQLPREALEWMARIGEPVRFMKRNYQGSVGILVGYKLEAVEYTIGVTEPGFDALRGVRIIEDKLLIIPSNMVAYTEWLGDVRDETSPATEEELAAEVLG